MARRPPAAGEVDAHPADPGSVGRRPPSRCFWELTAACDHSCLHCRMRAGEALPDELSVHEAEAIADQLASLGVRLVALTGGEPLLSPSWEPVARRLAAADVTVRLFTGGSLLDPATQERALEAGVTDFALSLDGPLRIHDRIRPLRRGARSSFEQVVDAVGRLLRTDAAVRLVTTVGRHNLHDLPETYELVRDLGVQRWQVQLCRSAGGARDEAARLLPRPEDLEAIVAVLLRAAKEGRVLAPMHCSIGYLTEEEAALRYPTSARRLVWDGADAGLRTLAIDPCGGVRGCVCLPPDFTTVSLRERTLAEIWEDDACFGWARAWSPDLLEGACADCALGSICRAGCPSVAWGATGSIGSNPYCLRLVRERAATR